MKANDMLKSRIIPAFILAVVLVCAGLYFGKSFLTNTAVSNKEIDPAELAGADVRTVIPIKDYNYMEILDSEKGIFIAGIEDYKNNKYHYDFIDDQGKIIESVEPKGALVSYSDRWLEFLKSDDDNCKTLIADTKAALEGNEEFKEYPYADIDGKSNHIIIDEGKCFKILDGDETLIYERTKADLSETPPYFAGKPGYIIVNYKDKSSGIVNYVSGKEEYRTIPGDEVMGYNGQKWEIYCRGSLGYEGNIVVTTFLDDEYEPAFNKAVCNSYLGNEKYISFVKRQVGISLNSDKAFGADILTNQQRPVVYDRDGNEFDYSRYGDNIKGIAGDTLIVGQYGKAMLRYVNLEGEDKGENRKSTTLLCFMDFEDDIAVACETKGNDSTDMDTVKEGFIKGYKWGFIDREFNKITEFDFDAAFETQNGYAVVGKNYKFGVIDFKGVRK